MVESSPPMTDPERDALFVREVLPLEGALMRFIQRNWRDPNETMDICQDVYARAYAAAAKGEPHNIRSFLFTVARNLLIDRARRAQVIPLELVADLDGIDLHRLVSPIGFDLHGRLRCQPQQCLDGTRRLLAGAKFQHLAEQHQHRDDCRSFEVDRHSAAIAAQRGGKQRRCQGRHDAVEPRSARAQRDEREHVQAAVLQRHRRTSEERPACPKYDRRAQKQLHPVRSLLRDEVMDVEEVPAHLQCEHRRGERSASTTSASGRRVR